MFDDVRRLRRTRQNLEAGDGDLTIGYSGGVPRERHFDFYVPYQDFNLVPPTTGGAECTPKNNGVFTLTHPPTSKVPGGGALVDGFLYDKENLSLLIAVSSLLLSILFLNRPTF